MKPARKMPVVMTVAGSDSGGGAGIQADLKVFSALDVFGTTAITCITAQTPGRVFGIDPIDHEMIALQMKAVLSAFPVIAAKTGMLYSADIISTVARTFARFGPSILVVDPVMIATSGGRLMQKQALHALCADLLPMATVITPNIPEAEKLLEMEIHSINDMKDAALTLSRLFETSCVLKGGHLDIKAGADRGKVVDILCTDGKLLEFRINRVRANNTHGTGCRFSAALTSYLAKNVDIRSAVPKAQQFVARTLSDPLYLGK